MQHPAATLFILVLLLTLMSACSDDADQPDYYLGFTVNGKAVTLTGGYTDLGSHALVQFQSSDTNTAAINSCTMIGMRTSVPTNETVEPTEWVTLTAKLTNAGPGTAPGRLSYTFYIGSNEHRYRSEQDYASVTLATVGADWGVTEGSFTATRITYQVMSNTNTGPWYTIATNLTVTDGRIRVYRIPNNTLGN